MAKPARASPANAPLRNNRLETIFEKYPADPPTKPQLLNLLKPFAGRGPVPGVAYRVQSPRARMSEEETSTIGTFKKHQAGAARCANPCAAEAGTFQPR